MFYLLVEKDYNPIKSRIIERGSYEELLGKMEELMETYYRHIRGNKEYVVRSKPCGSLCVVRKQDKMTIYVKQIGYFSSTYYKMLSLQIVRDFESSQEVELRRTEFRFGNIWEDVMRELISNHFNEE